jgi:hypothetical protein
MLLLGYIFYTLSISRGALQDKPECDCILIQAFSGNKAKCFLA